MRLRLSLLVATVLLASTALARADDRDAVVIGFRGEAGPGWEVVPQSDVVRIDRGQVFDRDVTIRNTSDREVLATIVSEIQPPAATQVLIHLGCGPDLTLVLGPGEVVSVPASWVVAEGPRVEVTAIEVVYAVRSFESLASLRLRAGSEIYAARCASCHGPRGRGDGPHARLLGGAPTDLGPALRDKSDRALLDTVRAGVGVMPAFAPALDDTERHSVLLFLRSLAPASDAGAGR